MLSQGFSCAINVKLCSVISGNYKTINTFMQSTVRANFFKTVIFCYFCNFALCVVFLFMYKINDAFYLFNNCEIHILFCRK